MKSIYKFLFRSGAAFSLAAILSSCAMDEPFGQAAEANLTLTTEIRGDVTKTRAISDDELSVLRDKCVVYIENNKGVIRKYKGLDNIPEEIKLRTGSYVAEAWSGDSVSASFDAKFYRGYQPFELAEGRNTLTLKCNIANVIVSVDPASLNVNLSDLKVTFSHSRGELVFTESVITDCQKGYFMMPNADKDINYKVEGTKTDGSAYVKEGKIEGVQRAHEYAMTLSEDPSEITEGGAVIRLTIADIPVIETEFEIFPAPAVNGVGFDNLDQIVSVDRNFSDTKLYIRGYFGLSSVLVNFSDNFYGLPSNVNILENSVITELNNKGIRIETTSSTDASADGQDIEVGEVYITFSKAFLDALPESNSEYTVTFEATDGQHKVGSGSLRIANSYDAIEVMAPVSTAPAPDPQKAPMAIGARSATLTGYVNDADAASNFGIKYRAQGSSEWTSVYPSSANASAARRKSRATRGVTPVPFTVKISGLEPDTNYEYKSFCDGYDNGSVNVFTTESVFVIPNASMEDWSTYTAKTMLGNKSVILPDISGNKLTAFWGTGNEGAATAKKVLTDKSSDMVHSGSYSARLASDQAMGILAAGNLFVGYYVETDGSDGVLKLGREYNGSHPSKLRFYANYRPGNVDIMQATADQIQNYNIEIVSGGLDHGQVYVALTDGPVDIRTKDKTLFNPNADYIIAYGQVTWKNAFGPDGQLQMVEIPLNYNDKAKTKRPTHIVITASAAKFGDFFSGSSSSVMYLDDFELVYE